VWSYFTFTNSHTSLGGKPARGIHEKSIFTISRLYKLIILHKNPHSLQSSSLAPGIPCIGEVWSYFTFTNSHTSLGCGLCRVRTLKGWHNKSSCFWDDRHIII
jgi:hypothetical protein